MNETPLIYTTKGNVPLDSVELKVEWFFEPEYVKLVEKAFDKASGELIKESAHVYSKFSVVGAAETGQF
jgi:hypothetical protein